MRPRRTPRQGEVWWAELDPGRGGEIHKTRPALVVSSSELHRQPLRLAMIAPLTTTRTGKPLHVEVRLPRGDAEQTSYVLPEHLRSVSQLRLTRRITRISPEVLDATRTRVALLLRDDN